MGSPGKRRADVRATRSRRAEAATGVSFWQRQLRAVVLPTVGVGAIAVAAAAAVTQPGPNDPQPQRVTVAQSEVSRAGERPVLAPQASVAQQVSGVLWVADDAEVRSDAAADAPVLAQVSEGSQVVVTGVVEGEWTQVLHNDVLRWVATASLSASEPLGTAACPSGSGVEKGLQPDTVKVHRAVCAKFPQIKTYGGVAARSGASGHPTGRALDIMVSGSLGDEIAQYVIDHAAELGASQVIWEQRIWEPGSGWSGMSDRGSKTANHFDHVHVTTYGDKATG
ncbi:MAG: SH3 domain-containing protein [Aeromicrobium sp.]|uniref:SH3 domain-containing protein n=1 Tax=Aeromicrobium sp. TaxID=1871063 RepID=UPI0039E53478